MPTGLRPVKIPSSKNPSKEVLLLSNSDCDGIQVSVPFTNGDGTVAGRLCKSQSRRFDS